MHFFVGRLAEDFIHLADCMEWLWFRDYNYFIHVRSSAYGMTEAPLGRLQQSWPVAACASGNCSAHR